MRFFLCGQTGSVNRGCEAIVRSTVSLLSNFGAEISLATFAPDQDENMARELGIEIIPYEKYPTRLYRYMWGAVRKLFKKSLVGYDLIERPLFESITTEDVCFNIGGDTYCYGRPVISLVLNQFAHTNKIPNILWCCSIEREKINTEILEDLKLYTYIFAREQITYDTLIEVGVPSERVIRCCDPAFFLYPEEVCLPDEFVVDNTVGINISDLVINSGYSLVYNNVKKLIKYILEETDMSVCLIPHVYSIRENQHDFPLLMRLYREFNNNGRILIVAEEYNCQQLKYIISKCRFFVGARTHATIAAYSSSIPTIALGYSVKSKGIATDLFGTYQDYVLPHDEIRHESELTRAFCKLMSEEIRIKNHYDAYLPTYKKLLLDAVEQCVAPYTQNKNIL